MATITITKFSFTPALSTQQVVHVKWRRTADPDISGSYTATADVTANSNGVLVTPLSITVPSQDITVVGTSACGSSGFAREFYIADCCPPTATKNGNTCTTVTTTTATSTGGTPIALCHYTNTNYAQYGTLIYSTYNLNGTAIASADSALVNSNAGGTSTSTVWGNPSSNTTDGRLNKTAVWDCADQTTPGDLGFGFQFTTAATKTYYIGFGADNTAKLSVDGVVIINQDAAAIGTALCGGPTHDECTFKYWHVYPISLSQGTHLINVVGHNAGSVGAFGCEIYDATDVQLKGCTTASGTYGDSALLSTNLHKYIVFTTQAVVDGTTSDIGNWTCPSGYSLVNTGSGYSCQQVTNTAVTRCPSSKPGVIVTPQSSTLTVAALYPKIKVVRDGFVLGATTPSTRYQAYSNAGYEVVITLNSAVSVSGNNTPFPTGSALTTYGSNLDAFFTASAGYNVPVVCIQNEEGNQSYWDGTAADYLAMLDVAIPKAHAAGRKITNGGLTGKGMAWMCWKDLQDNISTSRASAFAAKVFDSGDNYSAWSASNGPYQAAIAFMQTLIPGYASRNLDFVNFHWQEPSRTADLSNTSINNALVEMVAYLMRATGKRVITNELGQANTAVNILPQTLDLLMDQHLDYIIIYDGDDTTAPGNGGDYAMHDPVTNTIRATGTAVNTFLLTHQ